MVERRLCSVKDCDTCSRAGRAPSCSTRSLHCTLSPATLPSAQAACSRTSSLGLISSRMKIGTAPASITYRVCSEVPEAMFVRAQAASNCRAGFSAICRKSTKRCTTPDSITCWMGGFFSMDSRRLKCCVECSCLAASSESTFSRCSMITAGVASVSFNAEEEEASPPLPIPSFSGVTIALRFWIWSSFFSLRIWMVVSVRRRRDSSSSTPFLKPFLRDAVLL
mmetsp:Transcript_14938/g.32998  ORF Transcript_14938/g.32998 Transcript_14938/m.32998 type:complete len:223 (-) Transcript_14938:112-780(-)